jgi:hypothetical protein
VLIVASIHPEDEAEYACRATNAFGSRTTRAQLKMGAKPRVFVPAKYQLGVEVDHGQSIELRVPYKAFPEGKASWLHNGEPIVHGGGKYSIETDDR